MKERNRKKNKFEDLIKEKGVFSVAIAGVLGYSKATWSRKSKKLSHLTLEDINKLSAFFNVPIEELIKILNESK